MKLVSIIICILSMTACSNTTFINIEDSNETVIVRMNKRIEKITVVKFPFCLILGNSTLFKKEFGSIEYEYSYKEGGISIELYLDDQRITNDELKVVHANEKIKFLAYSRHLTDSSSFTQQQLQPYLNRMLELNQDTLHVGKVDEFKKRHPELFKMLTENDTISIRHLKGRNSGLGERIAIPANWLR